MVGLDHPSVNGFAGGASTIPQPLGGSDAKRFQDRVSGDRIIWNLPDEWSVT